MVTLHLSVTVECDNVERWYLNMAMTKEYVEMESRHECDDDDEIGSELNL